MVVTLVYQKMKKLLFIVFVLFSTILSALPQQEMVAQDGLFPKDPRKIENFAFQHGEKITYKIKYSLGFKISVGEVTFEVLPPEGLLMGRDVYHFLARGRTFGFYDGFFKVRDKYEAFMDKSSFLPLLALRDVHEGNIKFTNSYAFNHNKGFVKGDKKTKSIPDNTMDVISTLYYARNLSVEGKPIGTKFMFHTYIDDSAYYVGVQYLGKEELHTSLGKMRCLKLKPILIVGSMFKSENDMTMWVTDDSNHLPVKIESGISVGTVKVEISEVENLRNGMTAKL